MIAGVYLNPHPQIAGVSRVILPTLALPVKLNFPSSVEFHHRKAQLVRRGMAARRIDHDRLELAGGISGFAIPASEETTNTQRFEADSLAGGHGFEP